MPTTHATNPDGMPRRTKSIYTCVLAHLKGALFMSGMVLIGVMESICVQIRVPSTNHSLLSNLLQLSLSSCRALTGYVGLVVLDL
ncbi:hypothetical protein HHE014_10600 [Helicobacter heilmannii]|nr:hypothetical protein HHE014_10600 [Helicobacter heilmannii]